MNVGHAGEPKVSSSGDELSSVSGGPADADLPGKMMLHLHGKTIKTQLDG